MAPGRAQFLPSQTTAQCSMLVKTEQGPRKILGLHSTQQVPGYTQPDRGNQDINQYSAQTKQRTITSNQNESVIDL